MQYTLATFRQTGDLPAPASGSPTSLARPASKSTVLPDDHKRAVDFHALTMKVHRDRTSRTDRYLISTPLLSSFPFKPLSQRTCLLAILLAVPELLHE